MQYAVQKILLCTCRLCMPTWIFVGVNLTINAIHKHTYSSRAFSSHPINIITATVLQPRALWDCFCMVGCFKFNACHLQLQGESAHGCSAKVTGEMNRECHGATGQL